MAALDEIRAIYKERADTLADDIKDLHMGPRRLGRCEEVFAQLQQAAGAVQGQTSMQ